MRGVHTGEFFGIAPTGRETEVRTHDFHEIVDGRIARTHHMEDWLSWFQQVIQLNPATEVLADAQAGKPVIPYVRHGRDGQRARQHGRNDRSVREGAVGGE
jgi:hypothetical protein